MRISRAAKTRRRKNYIKLILLTFLIIIPFTAILSSYALNNAVWKDKAVKPLEVFESNDEALQAFKYSFHIEAKKLFRVELGKLEEYETAEIQINTLKKKKLNGFIVKNEGFIVAYGLFWNKSQADTALEFLRRKNIEGAVVEYDIAEASILYTEEDTRLIELASAIDEKVLKLISEKSALSLESLYSDKKISGDALKTVIEEEERLIKYLNYLKSIKVSEASMDLKLKLEGLLNELLIDRLQADGSYDYYSLQNSLMNQSEAIRLFYEKLAI
jgi:hypothetical protein